MNGRVITHIVAAVAALLGVGGGLYGADQRRQRNRVEQSFRERLQQIEAQLASKEREHAKLFNRFGRKNDQVRSLATEVTNLRAQIAAMRKSA